LGSVIDWNATGLASKQAETYLKEKARALEHAGFKAEAIVRTGVPGEELTKVAKEWKVSLFVMATHGRTGLDRFMLGSTADAMIRHGGHPVLLINAHAMYARMLEPYSVHEVMTAEATPLRSDESISIAITKLLRRGQSSAPVVDGEGALVGVISEHDLLGWHAQYVDALSRDETKLDPAAYCMQLEQDVVASIMTREVIPVESDAHLSAAVDLLLKHDLQNLPVTKDGQVVGMLDRSDALQALRARQAQLAANKI
jgi:CBS domain-containing protein